jgi:hypothetical protein
MIKFDLDTRYSDCCLSLKNGVWNSKSVSHTVRRSLEIGGNLQSLAELNLDVIRMTRQAA